MTEMTWTSAMLKALVRPMFVGPFTIVDYSAIESRVLAWIAGEAWKTAAFAEGRDMYVEIASRMGDYTRQQGKTAELALGFAGGIGALRRMGAKEESDDELDEIKNIWRSLHPRTTAFWRAMDLGFQQGGRAGRIQWVRKGRDMHAVLPSGRPLVYRDAKMFYDPVEGKQMTYIGPQGQRMFTWHGSLVENCLAGDSLVLTDRGWVRLDEITDERVWDGDEFVTHAGLKRSGVQPVIEVSGVRMTPDHKILTMEGWADASTGRGLDWPILRLPDGDASGRRAEEDAPLALPVLLRDRDGEGRDRLETLSAAWRVAFLRLSDEAVAIGGEDLCRANADLAPALPGMAGGEVPLRATLRAGVGELRRTWGRLLRPLAELLGLRRRHGADVRRRTDAGTGRRGRPLLPRELLLGHTQGAGPEQAEQPTDRHPMGGRDGGRSSRTQRGEVHDPAVPAGQRRAGERLVGERELQEPVYDLLNCGPRHRFTVLTSRGPLVVHNCVQATARDLLGEALIRLANRGYPIVLHVHDEIVLDGLYDVDDIAAQMCELEPWMTGLPLNAEGKQTDRYTK